MTQPEKELKILKRRLKEWEAEFFKTNGRKATIQDIANNPTIEGEYKKYRAEKKNLAGGSVSSKTDGTNKDTIRSKRKRPMTEENKNDPSTQQTISARSEGPETPFSGRRASYQFDSPRIQRYTSSTPTRRHSKVDTFVSSVHGNSPSHSRNNQNEPSNSQVSNLCRSPAHRRQKHSISPNQAAKRLLRTPTKLPSQSYTSPKALKSLETVFQESEIKGKPSLLDLFTQSAEKSPTIDAASPAAEPLALGGDESVQFFLEGMADTSFSTETPAGQSTQKHVPRRREKRPGLEGFAPSNSLDDAVTSSSKQPQNLKEPYSHSPSSSQSETQLLSPLSFKITRPSTGGIHNSVSPSTAKGEDIKNHIMPGFYSSLASTQNSRRLLISPDRRQRLLRQLSDHGGIGNVLMESPNNTQTTQDQLLQEDNLEEDNSPPEVWKKKPIQKRQTRRYKIPFVDTSISRNSQRPNTSKMPESMDESDSESNHDSQTAEEETPTQLLPQVRSSTRNKSNHEASVESSATKGSSTSQQEDRNHSQTNEKLADPTKPTSKARTGQRKSSRLNIGSQVSDNFVALRLPSKNRSKFYRRR